MILYRSHLFVPGGRGEMLAKAGRFPADVLCLDLEESVLPEEKARARELVRDAVGRLAQEGRTVHARLNSIESGETRDDLAAVVRSGLSSVLLAKTRSPQDVRSVDVLLRGSRFVRVRNCGHASPDWRPETFLKAVTEFIADVEACRPVAGEIEL